MKSTRYFYLLLLHSCFLIFHTLLDASILCRLSDTPQTCRENIAGCCDPGSLVCEADGCEAKVPTTKTDNCSAIISVTLEKNGST